MMSFKTIVTFIAAVGISLVAAHHRFGDSRHATGLISANGGKVPHPAVLAAGKDHYAQIVTATVLSPYKGNARIALEGLSEIDWDLYFQGQVIDLGIRRRPWFQENILYGLEPGDRIGIWVIMKPQKKDSAKGSGSLAFYDTESGKQVLRVPVVFKKSSSPH